MARSKAAVIIIIDVGHSDSLSSEEHSTLLKQFQKCASMTVQSKIFSRPKDEISVMLMGSEDSNNCLYNGDAYGNISVFLPLGESNWDAVRKLEKECYGTNITAVWTEAIIVALHYLGKESEVKKFNEKKIVLFTCSFKNGSSENISLIEARMKTLEAELIVIVPKLEERTEDVLAKEIVEQVNGTIYDLESAIPQLMSFQKKKVIPQAWNVCLDIGSKIKIPLCGRKKINDNQMSSWKTCLENEGRTGWRTLADNAWREKEGALCAVSVVQDQNKLGSGSGTLIEREVTYHRQDRTEVERDELVGGYCYGSTLVPFSEEDKQQLSYESGPKCLSVVKITKVEFVPRNMWMGKSGMCFVARDNDEHAALAFSAVVQALEHLKSVAIVRRVHNNGNMPYLGALIPCVKPKKEYLLYVDLPFAHDLRQCFVPKLEVGNLKEEQINAVDRLIDGMDLSEPVEDEGLEEYDEERVWGDLLKPQEICNPYYQHVRRCIAHRALNPDMPLPDLYPDTIKLITEPPQLVKDVVSDCLKEISILFPNLASIKSGEKRNIADSVNAKEKEPLMDEGGMSNKRVKEEDSENIPVYVGMLTPLEDFKAAIGQKDVSFAQVCSQTQDVILNLVLNSFGREDFEKPKELLKLLRSSVITNHADNRSNNLLSFNNWMKQLYIQLQEYFKMGFWAMVTEGKLGFISCEECVESTLTVEEVKKILLADDISIDLNDCKDEDMDVGDWVDNM